MNAIDRLAQLPDGADLYRGPTGQFACGWSRSDVLRFGVWFESEEAARMSWEMSDKTRRWPGLLSQPFGFTDWRGLFGGPSV